MSINFKGDWNSANVSPGEEMSHTEIAEYNQSTLRAQIVELKRQKQELLEKKVSDLATRIGLLRNPGMKVDTQPVTKNQIRRT